MDKFLNFVIDGLSSGAIYALIAMGFVAIYKSSKVVNFAQGMLVVVAAYTLWSFLSWTGFPIWLCVLLAIVVSMGLSAGIERICLRPLVGQPILASVMVALSLMVVIKGVIMFIWGGDLQRFPVEIVPMGVWRVGDIFIPIPKVIAFGVGLLIILLLILYYNYTRSGLAMRVASEDHTIAQSVGVRVGRVFLNSWAIGGLVAAISGLFLGTIVLISPELEMMGLKALCVMLLGGLESIGGALVGGLIVGVAEALAAGYLSSVIGGGIGETFPFILMILVLFLKPHGLFGWERIERV